MAKRRVSGLLVGAWVACLLPTAVHAQSYPDAVPIARAGGQVGAPVRGMPWPGYGGGPVQVSYQPPAPMPPGMPPMPPMPGAMMGGMPGAPMGGTPGGGSMGLAQPLPGMGMDYSAAGLNGLGGGPGGGPGCGPACKDDCCERLCHFYMHIGWLTLKRIDMKHLRLAQFDETGFDNELVPQPNRRTVLQFSDAPISMNDGFRVAMGLQFEETVFEVAGFFLPFKGAKPYVAQLPGQLTSFFINPPLGFEGTPASLWAQADVMSLHYHNTLGSGEINWKVVTCGDGWDMVALVGFRYVDAWEKLDFFTADDSVQLGVRVPETEATLSVRAHNHLMGAHFGCAASSQLASCFGIAWESKLGVYANYVDIGKTLTRGDGFQGFDVGDQKWQASHSYETGFYLNLQGNHWRLRGGYEVKWFVGVAKADNQFDFNLESMRTVLDSDGTLFFHGPTAMLDILF